MQSITSLSQAGALNSTSFSATRGVAAEKGPSFQEVLLDSLEQVNTLQQDANRAVENLATGGDTNPAEVLTAVQKADVAFRMMMQIRNKLVQAYQEVQNIRV